MCCVNLGWTRHSGANSFVIYVYEECRGCEKLGVTGVVVATAVAPSVECGTTKLGLVMDAFPAQEGHFRHTNSGRQLTEEEDLLRLEEVVEEAVSGPGRHMLVDEAIIGLVCRTSTAKRQRRRESES